MLASLALVPAAIGVLAPNGPDSGCPSPRQVADALGTHLPGVVLPLDRPPPPTALRLGVVTDAGGVTRVDLLDTSQETVLHRALSPSERARAPDCLALAETVALIVERYWHEVGYDLPPLERPPPTTPAPAAPAEVHRDAQQPAPSPPRSWSWTLGLAAAGRTGGGTVAAAGLAAAIEGRIGLRLSAGATETESASFSFATAHFRRYPLRLGAYLPVPLGPGQLEPGVGLDLDQISIGLTQVTADAGLAASSLCKGVFCSSPGADVALGWSVRSTHHVYLRALARAVVAVPYRFVADGKVVWSTPNTYAEIGLECGTWFP